MASSAVGGAGVVSEPVSGTKRKSDAMSHGGAIDDDVDISIPEDEPTEEEIAAIVDGASFVADSSSSAAATSAVPAGKAARRGQSPEALAAAREVKAARKAGRKKKSTTAASVSAATRQWRAAHPTPEENLAKWKTDLIAFTEHSKAERTRGKPITEAESEKVLTSFACLVDHVESAQQAIDAISAKTGISVPTIRIILHTWRVHQTLYATNTSTKGVRPIVIPNKQQYFGQIRAFIGQRLRRVPNREQLAAAAFEYVVDKHPEDLLTDLQTLAMKNNMELIFTVPYAPGSQPIEFVWHQIKIHLAEWYDGNENIDVIIERIAKATSAAKLLRCPTYISGGPLNGMDPETRLKAAVAWAAKHILAPPPGATGGAAAGGAGAAPAGFTVLPPAVVEAVMAASGEVYTADAGKKARYRVGTLGKGSLRLP